MNRAPEVNCRPNRLCRRGWLIAFAAAVLVPGGWAHKARAQDGEPGLVSVVTAGAAEREIARRQMQANDAEAVLREGDLLFSKGMLAEAVVQYRSAFLTLEQAPVTKPLREVALSKYERAATDYSQQLVREGRFDEALKVVSELLDPPVSSTNVEAKRLSKRLLTGDFYNRAITPEHVADVGRVEDSIKKGNDLINLGRYDAASIEFARVLSIDPTNTGARRALERIDNLVIDYANAANDHTRSKMLREVDQAWETSAPRVNYDPGLSENAAHLSRASDPASLLRSKLNTIVFPSVLFNGSSIEDVTEYLTQKSADLDTLEQNPAKKGVSIILNLGERANTRAARPVTLKLSSVPMVEILNYVTEQAGLMWRSDSYAVTIAPMGTQSDELILRKFRVPPTFLSGGAMGGGGGGEAADPFAAPSETTTKSELAPRLTAGNFLQNNGVDFPPGSFAQYIPETATLIVKNTPANIALIESIVLGSASEVPRQVLVEVRVIDTAQDDLKEIGFDWLLGPFSIGSGGVYGSGGTIGNTRAGPSTAGPAGDFPIIPPSDLPLIANPLGNVTSALRSGESATSSDSIADVIANSINGQAVSGAAAPLLAPGIFAVTGVLTDPQFAVVMRAVSQAKGTDVLATPSLVVRSGERAEFKAAREFIYPTEYDPPELPTRTDANAGTFPVTPANPTAFETRELGTLLQVEPLIGPDDLTVDLNISPEISDFIGFINYGSPITAGGVPITANRIVMPVFKSLKLTTNVSVYDGQTVVMGGLMESSVENVEDKIPVIGSLPVVGRLFRSKMNRQQLRAIVIFVKVRILDPSGAPVNEI